MTFQYLTVCYRSYNYMAFQFHVYLLLVMYMTFQYLTVSCIQTQACLCSNLISGQFGFAVAVQLDKQTENLCTCYRIYTKYYVCYNIYNIILQIVLILPAPHNQGFIVTANYEHPPCGFWFPPQENVNRPTNYNSTIMVTRSLTNHKSESA